MLHHVRTLVRTGFLAAEGERRGTRGAREVPYRATGKSWVLDVVDEKQERAAGIALVEAFLDDARRVGFENVDSTRMGLRLTPDEHEELNRRIFDLRRGVPAADVGGRALVAVRRPAPRTTGRCKDRAPAPEAMPPSEDDDPTTPPLHAAGRAVRAVDPYEADSFEDIDAESFDLEDRQALRRVPGLATELEDVTEVEYRQLRLERVVLVGVWTSGTVDRRRALAGRAGPARRDRRLAGARRR